MKRLMDQMQIEYDRETKEKAASNKTKVASSSSSAAAAAAAASPSSECLRDCMSFVLAFLSFLVVNFFPHRW